VDLNGAFELCGEELTVSLGEMLPGKPGLIIDGQPISQTQLLKAAYAGRSNEDLFAEVEQARTRGRRARKKAGETTIGEVKPPRVEIGENLLEGHLGDQIDAKDADPEGAVPIHTD